ncbi:MAG: EAL and modified HD-GYP domain-containing signal transduction protein [Gammaproteobacteria bacterium]|jgi:EAL and modified HD-GYP domain-containing signal transduction protein
MSASVAAVTSDTPLANAEVLLARQPIFDVDLQVHGYELLYRSIGHDSAAFDDADAASAEVITSGFMDIGLDRIVENKLAYINVSQEFLASGEPKALPVDRVALEFPGTGPFDDEFLAILDEYRDEGYRLVVDGIEVTPETLPVIGRVHAVKIDVFALGLEEALRQVELLQPLKREIIATRVESEEESAALEALGVNYLQGFFFAKPRVVSGTRVGSNKLTTLRLLASLYDPEAQVNEISALIGQDAGLSYKLMRFINSAALSLPGKVDSIRRAVVFMGLSALKRWASLIVVASVDDKPSELTRTLLVRARLCERLCTESGNEDSGAAFTVGLFSGLDALLDQPLVEALAELPLAPELTQALLEGEGVFGEALACALAYERGEWMDLKFAQLSAPTIGALYEESLEWAGEAMQGV